MIELWFSLLNLNILCKAGASTDASVGNATLSMD